MRTAAGEYVGITKPMIAPRPARPVATLLPTPINLNRVRATLRARPSAVARWTWKNIRVSIGGREESTLRLVKEVRHCAQRSGVTLHSQALGATPEWARLIRHPEEADSDRKKLLHAFLFAVMHDHPDAVIRHQLLASLSTNHRSLSSPAIIAAVRKCLADPEPQIVLEALAVLTNRGLATPQDHYTAAQPLLSAPAYESGLENTRYRRFTPLGAMAWASLVLGTGRHSQRQLTRVLRPLHELLPIHSLADFNPDPTRQKPVARQKAEHLQTLVRRSPRADPAIILQHYFQGGLPVLALSDEQTFLMDGHHRCAGLAFNIAAGHIPASWGEIIPVFEYHYTNATIDVPLPLQLRMVTGGLLLHWSDILPGSINAHWLEQTAAA